MVHILSVTHTHTQQIFIKYKIHVSLFNNLNYSCVEGDEKCKAHFDETQDLNIVRFYKPNLNFSSSCTCYKVMFNNICTNYTYNIMHVGNITV